MLIFTTKAGTLRALAPLLKRARVLPQVCVTVDAFRSDQASVLSRLREAGLSDHTLIVRSSAKNEDTAEQSNAGAFLSVGGLRGADAILAAAEKVAASMGDDPENELLFQPYLENVSLCGVAFTLDPNTLGDYYVLNYDDITSSTSSVTDGSGAGLKTFYCFKPARERAPWKLRGILSACAELEMLFKNHALDIEFAVSEGELYILQARPLVLRGMPAPPEEQECAVNAIRRKIATSAAPQPNLLGAKAIFGVMPDWNPAEMIGIRPRPLALSLYKELITDGVWAYQRDNYGYRNLRSFPLMVDFRGLPYIDSRISFNSFIPKELPDDLAEKLVNYYIDRLQESPEKHDKVEFEISFTCYTLDLKERISVLSRYGFSESERRQITDALRSLTNRILDSENGLWKTDAHKIDILGEKHREIMDSDLGPAEKVYWLLEYCKRYGTLPFAGLARAGFIAVQFLNSMVQAGVIDERERAQYMNGLSTVGKAISRDFGELSKSAFLKKYGHLRPGTYDIRSLRYDQAGDSYFDFDQRLPQTEKDGAFRLSIAQFSRFHDLLREHQIQADVLQMFDFIKQAIEGREYAKFVFTRTLSDVLELLAGLGEAHGLSREDMSYVQIKAVQAAYTGCEDMGELLRESAARGREAVRRTATLSLPPLIWSADQAECFFLPEGAPNYITQRSCTAPVLCLPTEDEPEGKILLIRSADPGYDWIFSRNIAAFITAYGGANSHMAIRAAEFGIPAVIGVGEKLFRTYSQAQMMTIDCANRAVRILR